MIDNSAKKTYLIKLLESPEFIESHHYSDLLSFLAKAALKGTIPKEATIASNVFGKDSNFNPTEDPAVRVYVHNLRKKLAKYYENEGKKDKIRLEIPKGHYELRYIENKTSFKKAIHRFFSFTYILLFALVVVLLALTIYLWISKISLQQSFQKASSNNAIWTEFINSEKPPLVLLGDYYFFSKRREDNSGNDLVRGHDINSIDDLEKFNNNLSDGIPKLKPSRIQLFEKNNAFSIQHISNIFYSHHKKFYLRPASQLQPQDLLEYNIVYIGNFRFAGLLQKYFKTSTLKYQYDPTAKLFYSPESSDSTITYSKIGVVNDFHTDYALIAKLPGPNGNSFLLIASFFSTGSTQAIKSLSTRADLAHIENKMKNELGHIPPYFEILLEVTGLDRVGFSSKIVFINELKSEMNIWSPRPLN
jgi:hypothetical protein